MHLKICKHNFETIGNQKICMLSKSDEKFVDISIPEMGLLIENERNNFHDGQHRSIEKTKLINSSRFKYFHETMSSRDILVIS